MTGHLPECEAYRDECGGGCICHHVRACEERVYTIGVEVGKHDGWLAGQAAGVAAAREAAAALEPDGYCDIGEHIPVGDALAAIDALREKEK